MKRISILVLCFVLLISLASCTIAGNGGEIGGESGGEVGHQHTFGNEFQSNETHHWIGTTCTDEGCADVKVAEKAHVDADGNKICDVCGYDAGHEHVYAEDYSYDAQKHWKEVLCGHDVAKAEEAAHTAGANGVCTVCGLLTDVEITSVEDAIALGKLWQSAVKYGESKKYFAYADEEAMLDELVKFDFEKNYVHYTQSGYEYWIHLVDEDNILVICDDGYDVSRIDFDVSPAMIGGFGLDIAVIGAVDTENIKAYGVVQIIELLYDYAKSSVSFNFTESIDDGTYSFAFGTVCVDNWDKPLCMVEVEFTLGDTYEIDTLSITSTQYNSVIYDDDYNEISNYTATPVLDGEGNEVLDDYGNPVYTYSLDDNSQVSRVITYSVFQSTDEKEELPYEPDSIIIKDFNFTTYDENYEEVVVESGSKFTLGLGMEKYFYFANVVPSIDVMSLNKFTVTVTDLDGNEVYSVNAIVEYGSLVIRCSEVGNFLVSVSTEGSDEFVLEIEATRPAVEYMELKQLVEDIFEDDWVSTTYKTWGYFDGEVYATCNIPFVFYAEFNSPYCDTEVTIVVTDADGNVVSADDYEVVHGEYVEVGMVDYSGYYPSIEWVDTQASTIAFKNAGVYTVTVTSVENEDCTGSFTVVAEEAEVRFGGTWNGVDNFGNEFLTVVIDEDAGTVTFNYSGYHGGTTLTFNYTVTDGIVALTDSNGDPAMSYMYGLTLDANGNPMSAVYEMSSYTLTYSESGAGDVEIESGLNGTYYVGGEMFVLTFEDGVLEIFDNNDGTYSGTYYYTEGDEGITVTNTNGTATEIIISMDMGGNYTFWTPGFRVEQQMSK